MFTQWNIKRPETLAECYHTYSLKTRNALFIHCVSHKANCKIKNQNKGVYADRVKFYPTSASAGERFNFCVNCDFCFLRLYYQRNFTDGRFMKYLFLASQTIWAIHNLKKSGLKPKQKIWEYAGETLMKHTKIIHKQNIEASDNITSRWKNSRKNVFMIIFEKIKLLSTNLSSFRRWKFVNFMIFLFRSDFLY